jgi:hypothetical protein
MEHEACVNAPQAASTDSNCAAADMRAAWQGPSAASNKQLCSQQQTRLHAQQIGLHTATTGAEEPTC